MLIKTKIVFAAALILGTASASLAGGQDDPNDRGGYVIPCSLVGVNPVYHPEIFGGPSAARDYGFVKSRDGSWQVQRNCVRGPYHN